MVALLAPRLCVNQFQFCLSPRALTGLSVNDLPGCTRWKAGFHRVAATAAKSTLVSTLNASGNNVQVRKGINL
jgi:hypothetical protein